MSSSLRSRRSERAPLRSMSALDSASPRRQLPPWPANPVHCMPDWRSLHRPLPSCLTATTRTKGQLDAPDDVVVLELLEQADLPDRGRRHALVLGLEPDLLEGDDLARVNVLGLVDDTVRAYRSEEGSSRLRSARRGLGRIDWAGLSLAACPPALYDIGRGPRPVCLSQTHPRRSSRAWCSCRDSWVVVAMAGKGELGRGRGGVEARELGADTSKADASNGLAFGNGRAAPSATSSSK